MRRPNLPATTPTRIGKTIAPSADEICVYSLENRARVGLELKRPARRPLDRSPRAEQRDAGEACAKQHVPDHDALLLRRERSRGDGAREIASNRKEKSPQRRRDADSRDDGGGARTCSRRRPAPDDRDRCETADRDADEVAVRPVRCRAARFLVLPLLRFGHEQPDEKHHERRQRAADHQEAPSGVREQALDHRRRHADAAAAALRRRR